jgi:acyl-homoserine lactone acylase PvdQ
MIWKYAFIDVDEAKADYKKAAPWLKKLLNSYADGINFYLINILK